MWTKGLLILVIGGFGVNLQRFADFVLYVLIGMLMWSIITQIVVNERTRQIDENARFIASDFASKQRAYFHRDSGNGVYADLDRLDVHQYKSTSNGLYTVEQDGVTIEFNRFPQTKGKFYCCDVYGASKLLWITGGTNGNYSIQEVEIYTPVFLEVITGRWR